MPRYAYTPFAYRRAPELDGKGPAQYPVVIVGAGPVGLTAAIDLALHGVPSVVLDDNDVVSLGSRAICWSKRTLEIFDRLGVGVRMLDKGVTWKVGRLYHRDREVWSFDLLPEPGHRMPAFINLQQYYVEQYLVERAAEFPDLIDLRWKNRVTGVSQRGRAVEVAVDTPDGAYSLEAAWLLACDGARSPVRAMLGLELAGRAFEERFLIADVEMQADFPSERWFWFEPPFHAGQSALLHKQPDNIYRIDLQLGPDADPETEKRPENVLPRIERMIGHRNFELDWVSVYAFQCGRLERFVHERIVFAGDSAHVVSPFGARGGNGGIQDVDNLVWKLALVLEGAAPESLIDSYDAERIHGADENIVNSERATAFMTPKSDMERLFRDGVLELAATQEFARRMVNSGRLSKPCSLAGFPLQTPCEDAGAMRPGMAMLDAPVAGGRSDWLLNHLGNRFAVLAVGTALPRGLPETVDRIVVSGSKARPEPDTIHLDDPTEAVAERYGESITYLIRPDQHVAARFAQAAPEEIAAALNRAMGKA